MLIDSSETITSRTGDSNNVCNYNASTSTIDFADWSSWNVSIDGR